MSELSDSESSNINPEETSQKVARILALDVEQFPQFRQNHSFAFQRDGSRYALHAVQEAIKSGYLDLTDFGHVIDFGAGGGGPTFLLDQICRITGGEVEATEESDKALEVLKEVIPSVPVHAGNGLDYLNDIEDGTASLITAFTLGPDYTGELFTKLAQASSKALALQGKLVVFSDVKTITAVFDRITSANIETEDLRIVPEMNKNDTYKYIPRTAILSKQGVSLVK